MVKTRQASAAATTNSQAEVCVIRGNLRPYLRFGPVRSFPDTWVSPAAAGPTTDDQRKAHMLWTYLQVYVMGVVSWLRLVFSPAVPPGSSSGGAAAPPASLGGSEFMVKVPLLVNKVAVAKGAELLLYVPKPVVEKRAAKPIDTSGVVAQVKRKRQQ